VFVLILLGTSTLPQKNSFCVSKELLWKIQSKTNTVYVLGSLHYCKKEIYPLSEKIGKAFTESEILVVEADVMILRKLTSKNS